MYEVTILKVSGSGFTNYSYIITDLATRAAAVIDPAWELAQYEKSLHCLHLQYIFLTHAHFDHTDLVAELARRYQPQIFISEFEVSQIPNSTPVQDGQSLQLGLTSVQVLHTPGHSPGGLCYLLENDLFTGDTLFIEGCGICHLQGGSAQAMFESFRKIRQTVPCHAKVWPGHSFGKPPGMPLHQVIDQNIYFHFETADDFAKFRLRNTQPAALGFR